MPIWAEIGAFLGLFWAMAQKSSEKAPISAQIGIKKIKNGTGCLFSGATPNHELHASHIAAQSLSQIVIVFVAQDRGMGFMYSHHLSSLTCQQI